MLILRTMAVVVGMLLASSAWASMRCADGILSTAEDIQSVLSKCGEPDSRAREPAEVDGYGALVPNAVPVERWVYGPQNGMYYHLRFVDGRLAEVRSRRSPQ
ncbi:DUF2845 domain-containing protein [Halopseudomonas pelagia]|nr:DUF2845 domain-containing protein [Halopseudomonas pelagia]